MKFRLYNLLYNSDIRYYVEGLNHDDVILDSYFFMPLSNNFFSPGDLYSNDELEIILYTTDKEYYYLASNYLGKIDFLNLIKDRNDEKYKIEHNINQLNEIKSKKDKLNELNIKINEIENEVKSLESSINTESTIQNNLMKYKNLLNLNLDKISEDLTNITKDISELEKKLIELKSKELRIKKNVYTNNQFIKYTLFAFFVSLSVWGALTYFFNFSLFLTLITWGLFILFTIVFFVMNNQSKNRKDFSVSKKELNQVQDQLNSLINRKNKILSLVGFDTPDEFFMARADIFLQIKSLKILRGDNDSTSLISKYNMLKEEVNRLKSEKYEIESLIKVTDQINEDPSKLRSKLDKLKQDLDLLNNLVYINKFDIPSKLVAIREELKEILVSYKSKEESNWVQYYDSIVSYANDFCRLAGIKNINIEKNSDFFGNLDIFRRFIVYLSFIVASSIQSQKFFFIACIDGFYDHSLFVNLLNKIQSDNIEVILLIK